MVKIGARALVVSAVLLLAACSSVKEGAVVSKRARAGLPYFYASRTLYTFPEPDVYWVVVKGHTANGRLSVRSVLLDA